MDPFSELSAAIHAGDTGRASDLLRQHPEWNQRLDQPLPGASFGATPLLVAVGRRNRELIDVLLGAGASIDARSHWWAGSFGVLDNDGDLADYAHTKFVNLSTPRGWWAGHGSGPWFFARATARPQVLVGVECVIRARSPPAR